MRAARRCLPALVVLTLLLAVPGSAQAAEGQGEVVADLPAQMNGDLRFEAPGAKALVMDGRASVNVDGGDALLTLYTYEQRYYVESVDHEDLTLVDTDRRVRTIALDGEQINVAGDGASILVEAAGTVQGRMTGEIVPPQEVRWDRDTTAAFHAADRERIQLPLIEGALGVGGVSEGRFGAYGSSTTLSSHGPVAVTIFDAPITYTDGDEVRSVQTGTRITQEDAQGRVEHVLPVPDTPLKGGDPLPDTVPGIWDEGTTEVFLVHEVTYAILQVQPGSSAPDLTFQASSQNAVYAERVKARLHGSIQLEDAVGTLTTDDEAYELDHDEVQISGRLSIQPDPDRGASDEAGYRIDGEVSYLRIGDRVHTFEHDPMMAVVIGLALGAAGVLAYLWPMLKFGLFNLFGVPLYSRFQEDDVLGHDVRNRIYEIIKDDPGVSISTVADRADVGWGTAVYHLGVLEENGLVVSMRDGRYKRYYQNGGRYRGKKEALAAIRNDTTRSIARAVLENPGITQSGLCEKLDISAPLAHWHLDKLQEAEVVDQQRDGRYKRHYVPEPARETLSAHLT